MSSNDPEVELVEKAKNEALEGAKAYKTTSHAERVYIVNPTDLKQILQIVSGDGENGIINYLRKQVSEALDYAKRNNQEGFAPGVSLAVSVEAMTAEPRDKVLKQKFEYRRPLAGLGEQQLNDLLAKLPVLAEKVTKNGQKIPARLRFGFHYGLAHEFSMPFVMTKEQLLALKDKREASMKSGTGESI